MSDEPVCTKENPDKKLRVHPDAKCVYDGSWDQEYETYHCPNCDLRFDVTIPG